MTKVILTKEERDRLVQLAGKELAYVYMLLTVAIYHAEEAEVLIKKLGYMRNEVKMNVKRLMADFDHFFEDFKKYIGKDDGVIILRDFERLKPEIDKLLKSNL